MLKVKNEGPDERAAARDTNLYRALRHHWNNRKCGSNKLRISLKIIPNFGQTPLKIFAIRVLGGISGTFYRRNADRFI
jgi:hypothetical protein